MTLDSVDIIGSIVTAPSELAVSQIRAHESIQELAHQGDRLAVSKLGQEELEQNPSMVATDKTFLQLAEEGDPTALAQLQTEAGNMLRAQGGDSASITHVDQYV